MKTQNPEKHKIERKIESLVRDLKDNSHKYSKERNKEKIGQIDMLMDELKNLFLD